MSILRKQRTRICIVCTLSTLVLLLVSMTTSPGPKPVKLQVEVPPPEHSSKSSKAPKQTDADFADQWSGRKEQAVEIDQQLKYASVETLNRLSRSKVLDKSGDYFVIKNFLMASRAKITGTRDDDVTIATQCTSNHIHYLVNLAERWQGPVSVSVFTYDSDFHIALNAILYLNLCHLAVSQYVTFHLSYPVDHSPEDFPSVIDKAKQGINCSSRLETRNKKSFKNYSVKGIEYPVNMLRTLSLRNALTSYVFYIDVDLMPSDELRSRTLTNFLRKILTRNPPTKSAYIVPAFELKDGAEFPGNKSALLRAWDGNQARPFGKKRGFDLCQKPTNYTRWRTLLQTERLEVAYTVKYKSFYEPHVITAIPLPFFDERFRQAGFNRLSQICEMHVAGYQFMVLNNVFLLHDGLRPISGRPSSWNRDFSKNGALYKQFKKELRQKYPQSNRTCS